MLEDVAIAALCSADWGAGLGRRVLSSVADERALLDRAADRPSVGRVAGAYGHHAAQRRPTIPVEIPDEVEELVSRGLVRQEGVTHHVVTASGASTTTLAGSTATRAATHQLFDVPREGERSRGSDALHEVARATAPASVHQEPRVAEVDADRDIHLGPGDSSNRLRGPTSNTASRVTRSAGRVDGRFRVASASHHAVAPPSRRGVLGPSTTAAKALVDAQACQGRKSVLDRTYADTSVAGLHRGRPRGGSDRELLQGGLAIRRGQPYRTLPHLERDARRGAGVKTETRDDGGLRHLNAWSVLWPAGRSRSSRGGGEVALAPEFGYAGV